MSEILLTYYGHACFAAEYAGYRVVFDPYEDGSVPGYRPLRLEAQQVLCSHAHHDHAFRSAVTLREGENPFRVEKIAVFHDDQKGALRGENTIHILEAGGLRIAHFGDLGHPLSEEQIGLLGRLDAVMLPVGGYYTIDAQQASALADRLQARIVLPMHAREGERGYDVLGTVEDFLALRSDVIRSAESTLRLTSELPRATVALHPLAAE